MLGVGVVSEINVLFFDEAGIKSSVVAGRALTRASRLVDSSLIAEDEALGDGERASVDPGLLQDAVEWARIAAETDPDAENRTLAREAPDAIKRMLAAVKAAD